MDISGHVIDLLTGKREFGHALFDTAVVDDIGDVFAVAIVQHHFRAEQIGAAFATAGIGAMAEVAVHAIEGFAAFQYIGGGLWVRRVGWWTLRVEG